MLNLTIDQNSIALIGALGMSALVLVSLILSAVVAGRSRRSLRELLQGLSDKSDLVLSELRSQAELIKRLESRTQARDSGANDSRSFDAAVRMARTGASTDQLTANSGLTKQEARLIARLHGPEKLRA